MVVVVAAEVPVRRRGRALLARPVALSVTVVCLIGCLSPSARNSATALALAPSNHSQLEFGPLDNAAAMKNATNAARNATTAAPPPPPPPPTHSMPVATDGNTAAAGGGGPKGSGGTRTSTAWNTAPTIAIGGAPASAAPVPTSNASNASNATRGAAASTRAGGSSAGTAAWLPAAVAVAVVAAVLILGGIAAWACASRARRSKPPPAVIAPTAPSAGPGHAQVPLAAGGGGGGADVGVHAARARARLATPAPHEERERLHSGASFAERPPRPDVKLVPNVLYSRAAGELSAGRQSAAAAAARVAPGGTAPGAPVYAVPLEDGAGASYAYYESGRPDPAAAPVYAELDRSTTSGSNASSFYAANFGAHGSHNADAGADARRGTGESARSARSARSLAASEASTDDGRYQYMSSSTGSGTGSRRGTGESARSGVYSEASVDSGRYHYMAAASDGAAGAGASNAGVDERRRNVLYIPSPLQHAGARPAGDRAAADADADTSADADAAYAVLSHGAPEGAVHGVHSVHGVHGGSGAAYEEAGTDAYARAGASADARRNVYQELDHEEISVTAC